jgi:hypothetical protein
MGAFSALRQFFSPKQPFVAPVDDPFVQLDRAEAVKELRLKERGAEQGAHNLPPSDTQTFDNIETEIVARVSEHHSRAQIDAANQLRTYDERLAQLVLLAELASIRSQARMAVSDFEAEVANWDNRLATSRDAIAESYAELREFRQANRLVRPAYPVPPEIVTWGTILMAWLFESAINTFLLRQNDAMGLVGGFLAAATIALLNVGVSAFVGRQVWPRTNYPRLVPRTLAQIGTALWLALLLVWNLLAAHFRDAKSFGMDNPESQSLTLLVAQPLGLDSIYSWGLFAAGIVGAVLAAIAAYRMDDPFPGYGLISRRHTGRCNEYAEEIKEASEELRDIREDAKEEAEKVRAELGTQLRERDRVLAARQTFCRRYEEDSTLIEQTGNYLLEVYRAANRKARSEPVPGHFAQAWKMDRRPLPDTYAPTALQPELQTAERALEEAVMQIADRFDVAIRSFESLENLKRRLAHAAP